MEIFLILNKLRMGQLEVSNKYLSMNPFKVSPTNLNKMIRMQIQNQLEKALSLMKLFRSSRKHSGWICKLMDKQEVKMRRQTSLMMIHMSTKTLLKILCRAYLQILRQCMAASLTTSAICLSQKLCILKFTISAIA